MTGLIRGRLVVSMVTACTVTSLFDGLSSFRLAHLGVPITLLLEEGSDRLIEDVRPGTTDLALIGAAGTPPTSLESLVVVKERLVAAVPSDHPLARRDQATLAEIAAYPIVSLPRGARIRAVFHDACATEDVHADIALQASVTGLAVRGWALPS